MMSRDFKKLLLDVNKITDNKFFLGKHTTSFSWVEKVCKQNNFWGYWRKHHIWWFFNIRETEFFFSKCNKNSNENWYIVDSSSSITDPVDKTANTYKNYSTTILLMKEKLENVGHFLFKEAFYKWNWERIQQAKLENEIVKRF